MTRFRIMLALMLVILALLLAAGCTSGPAGISNISGNATIFPTTVLVEYPGSISIKPTFTPATKLQGFFQEPVALHKNFIPKNTIGSFEDSFIMSYDCTESPETYELNYTLITGSAGQTKIKYTLIPISYIGNPIEVPLSNDILNATIDPDEFIAESSQVYTSRFSMTLGPNVTGKFGNPSYTFLLNVSIDGVNQSDLSDQVNIIKWCNIHSQTRNMQGIPGFENMPKEISMHAGETIFFNLSFRNFGGGIREFQYKIPTGIKEPGFGFPLESNPDQNVPIPEGVSFSFNPPVIIGKNFQVYSDTLVISTRPNTPSGIYYFPLEICYRNLDLSDTGSDHFPFAREIYCPSSGSFQVTIGG
jgi:hypothetical protein